MTRILGWMTILLSLVAAGAGAQQWTGPVRGSWVQSGAAREGDVTLATPDGACDIVIAPTEHSAVQQAAKFLAADIEKISGKKPDIVSTPTADRPSIVLETISDPGDPLAGQWEAYRVRTDGNSVHLAGSNFRGTAFAAYTLSERLGVDPLYLWTGYTPEFQNPLVLKATDFQTGPPTFKFRGLFHDDEDILPRPIDPGSGYPFIRGTVPDEWYQRFFETALRLRMNQVAPFTRAFRPFHIQQMASDWGLFYTSHHYDILLSNPYGFDRFGLARERGVTGGYDYLNNKAMVEKYWRAGVQENKDLDAIYPVGLRGTDDYPYNFPPGATLDDKARIYQQVIGDQVNMAKAILPPGKTPLFHLTLYNEMLDLYRQGKFDVPSDVMLIWDDNGDGLMRALPDTLGKWKHGVYYHLAFFGGTSKQSVHTVTPMRIAAEFKKVVDSGAAEYLLVNVSELREFVMEARMLAEIGWDANTALAGSDPAGRYISWWCREYFGAAAPQAEAAYREYYNVIPANSSIWYGSDRVRDFLNALRKKISGQTFARPSSAQDRALAAREQDHAAAQQAAARAMQSMTPEQRQFFFEHVSLGLLMDYRPVQAARTLYTAFDATDVGGIWDALAAALPPVESLEAEIKRAERPPFQDWYRPTWIRVSDPANSWSSMNIHRPYQMLTSLLRTGEVPLYTAARPFASVGNGPGEISGDLRGIAVNRNTGSPYYGYVYICDRQGQANRVRIYRPVPERLRNAAAAYEDTGLSIKVNSSTSSFPGGVYAPMGVSIGDDDTVWIADFSERQIETAPPVPMVGNDVVSIPIINLPDFDALASADLPAGWTVGHPRNVSVSGAQDNATVLVINNTSDGSAADNTVQKFTVNVSRRTASHAFTHAFAAFAGTNPDQKPACYTAAMDPDGNIYLPMRGGSGQIAIEKLDPNGSRRPFNARIPEGAPDAAWPGIAFVRDPGVPGGGYLYWSGRVTDTTRQIVHRFDLEGNLLDGFGAFYGSDILSGNVLGYVAADDTGSIYARLGNSNANANFMKVVRVPPAIKTNGPVRSSPAAANGIVYFGSEDGRLYAVDAQTGLPPDGGAFPVDVRAAAGDGAFVSSRPAVRDVGGAMFLFFTTSDGRMGRVGLDGRGLLLTPPLATPNTRVTGTPAVSDGVAYVALGDGTSASVYRVDAGAMTPLAGAAALQAAKEVRSTLVVFRGSLYVGTDRGVFRLTDDGRALTVQAQFMEPANGSGFVDVAAPDVPTFYASGVRGNVHARNAITFAPITRFGINGLASLGGGEPLTGSPFAVDGMVYVGGLGGNVYALRESDGRGNGIGGSALFFQIGADGLEGVGISSGLAAAPALDGGWNIVFGARNGLYYQVRAHDPTNYRVTAMTNGLAPPFNTVPAVDAGTRSEFIGGDDGRVYRIPGL